MTYIVEFEVDGDSVSYTVKADNVLDAEEAAKRKTKNRFQHQPRSEVLLFPLGKSRT